LTADKTCTARFRSAITPAPLEEQSYVLTVQRQGQGTVRSTPNGIECGQLCRYEFPSTQAVHLTAHAAGGFIFAGWHPQDCAQPLTLTAPLTCTAVFEAQLAEPSPTPEVPIVEETPSVSVEEYPLMVGIKGKGSIQITPPGLSCQQQCRQSYAEGTVVTLTALAEIDTVFSGWQGDCEGQQPSLTQTLNAARTCEAVFQPLGQPVISLSPMRYDFGAIWIGNTAQQKFILHNLGQQPLEVAEIQLTAPEFILTQSCNNKRLAPEAQCPLTVAFQPQAEGQHRATLLIHSNDPQTQRLIVSLNGEGYIAQPETPLCPPSGWINSVCDNRGQTITDATLGPQASVAGGQFAGDIRSQGLVSLVTIQAGAQLTGGKLTGYILNEGTLADFEFVGAILSGGTLAGHIINSSQVGGRFENVHLAANTYIRGGQLQGEIIGTAGAPALLEYLTISAGSYLNHVILGEGVMLMEAVNLGEQVTVTASSTLIEPAESESSLPLEQDLPLLGNSVALAPQAESMTSKAQFNGGISVNFGDFHPQTTARLADFIDIRGILTVDPEHINRLADIVVYAVYQPDADAESSFAYMLNAQGQIVPWDRDLNSLTAFIEQTVLTPRHTIQMYSNQFHLPGVLTINFGYRLYQGPLMTHETPIKVIVTP
ncbi:MAG: choice-of-anchor D domain-containing protein, partial [Pseudomonadota bacterium]|nr:choice-of-anchor D domain-containing protein [Pseudomonadota bacterium]